MGISRISRTPLRRFVLELGASASLGIITTVAAAFAHATWTPLTPDTAAMRGVATVDDPERPQWLSVVYTAQGATAVLSRHVATVDASIATDVIASAREGAAQIQIPTWSRARNIGSDDADLRSHAGPLFEQVHGWPMPMLYRSARVDMGELSEAHWALLPPGVVVGMLFYSVAWLLVIRLPGSVKRAGRWLKAKRDSENPHPGPLPRKDYA